MNPILEQVLATARPPNVGGDGIEANSFTLDADVFALDADVFTLD